MQFARLVVELILFALAVGVLVAWGCAWIFHWLDARRDARERAATDRLRDARARGHAELRARAAVPHLYGVRPADRWLGLDAKYTARRVEFGVLSPYRNPIAAAHSDSVEESGHKPAA